MIVLKLEFKRIYLQDELSDDNFNSSKQPIILREEHPGEKLYKKTAAKMYANAAHFLGNGFI